MQDLSKLEIKIDAADVVKEIDELIRSFNKGIDISTARISRLELWCSLAVTISLAALGLAAWILMRLAT